MPSYLTLRACTLLLALGWISIPSEAKPVFSMGTKRSYAFVNMQAWLDRSEEGRRAKAELAALFESSQKRLDQGQREVVELKDAANAEADERGPAHLKL